MVHLWLGLASGLVVFALGVTGCIWSFSEEIKTWIYRDRLFVELSSAAQQKQPLSILFKNAQAALDSTHVITRAQLFEDPNRTYQFRALKIDPDAFGYWNYYTYYELVYINPYTAKVVHIENAKYEFFTLTLALHMNLLLGKPIGHWIVQWSVVIFIILLFTGLVAQTLEAEADQTKAEYQVGRKVQKAKLRPAQCDGILQPAGLASHRINRASHVFRLECRSCAARTLRYYIGFVNGSKAKQDG